MGTTGGGEFGVYANTSTSSFLFNTFCLETNEYVTLPGWYYVESVTKEARSGGSGGPSPDPISDQTAYLYTQYLAGTLLINDVAGANDLQRAIWYLEQENLGLSNQLTAAASTAVTSGVWIGTGDVMVMNLRYYNYSTGAIGGQAQDMLYSASVPEPMTLLLLGTGLIGVAAFRRKIK
jgi:hypothetical protein